VIRFSGYADARIAAFPAARPFRGEPPADRRCPKRVDLSMAVTIDYEVTYILRPSLEETEIDERINTLADSLRTNGGEVVGEIEKMGKRRLAYEIDDVREGYYVVMKFKSDAAQAKELERQMRLNDDVMRALLIKLEE
jgi:small subunit ribosomal protein S6